MGEGWTLNELYFRSKNVYRLKMIINDWEIKVARFLDIYVDEEWKNVHML